ncbi:MAG: hypothetical protein AseanaTS_14420 [Candidatus Pelagadaptatus aseana]|uniref:hypothetical protein n=1 Tax=Candidatus Pelagadaptatus aseana TaxID=3120508 RepID=UPI0039B308FC
MDRETWKAALKQHYTAPMEQTFKQFRLGAMLFFLGAVILYIAFNNLQASLLQELVTLLGLIIGGIGFLIAMLAQIRMLISRIVQFFNDK